MKHPDPQPPGTGPRFDTIELADLSAQTGNAHYVALPAVPSHPVVPGSFHNGKVTVVEAELRAMQAQGRA